MRFYWRPPVPFTVNEDAVTSTKAGVTVTELVALGTFAV